MKSRLHIALYSNAYHPVISGVVRSVAAFRQALTAMGHNVFVFAQGATDYEDEEPFIFRYPALELPLTHNIPLPVPISAFIDRVIPHLKLDVIHSHHPALLGQTAVNKAEEHQLPLVFTYHTRYEEYSHYLRLLPQELMKKVIKRWVGDYMSRCQHVVVPAGSIQRMLQEEYGIVERVTVLPTGIDLTPFQRADGRAVRQQQGWGQDRVIISVGRLEPEKNWPTLITAVARVMASYPDLRLALLGGGDERPELEALAGELGVAERVYFAGPIPMSQVPAYLKAADLFCFASITETQGLVTMEAMAAGLPVVAVRATGTADVIEDGIDGLLADNDSEALAAALGRILADDNLAQALRQAAGRKVATFAIEKQAQKLAEVYHQAMADKAAGHSVSVDVAKPIFTFDWQQWLRPPDESDRDDAVAA
ncbi:MAG: glycosyltransferase [Chloroflexi bacterium]|nr:glycosyltransferase [Chloroflexota bacterium]MCI0580278.1 glycosyltransferase [Chloroflexota bacterium]MCI0643689.1 glycosyltransferase [Chloroflexota bacterium]MCI0729073.1 glycosyltransferase [Chloroflexota bacterium]